MSLSLACVCVSCPTGLDFTKVAEGYGVSATHAADPDQLRALLAEETTGPRLIQVDTVPTTPA